MKRDLINFVALMLATSAGCGNHPINVSVPPFDSPAMAAKALEEKDADKDGALSAVECKSWPELLSAFKAIYANKDGKLDRDELEKRFQGYAVGNIGMQSQTCFVFSNGAPVSDAVVEFTPQSLFTDYDKPGRATTGRDGSGPLLPIGGGLPGVVPGMYRVTISKKVGEREAVPKKFNEETEIGFEVSNALGGAPAKFDIAK